MDLLNGVRVIDLSELGPGPFCTMLLADMGAEVIKVERPKGDPVRKMIPGVYQALNRNKKSIILNLKNKAGKKLLFSLIEKANIFIESYRPGVAKRLGVGYERVKTLNEKIIYCSISGYGQSGPYSSWPGHDINYCAVAGISSISGQPSGPPAVGSGIPIADYSSSLYACIAILSMLFMQRGGFLDVCMTDCALSLMSTRVNEYVAGGRPAKEKFIERRGYGIFKAKDGRYLAIGLIEKHFWQHFLQVLRREGIAKGMRLEFCKGVKEVNSILEKVFLAYSRDEWISILSKADLPCSPVNFIEDIPNDQHIKSRGLIAEREQNGQQIMNILFPVRFDEKQLPLRSLAPAYPGQNTNQILLELGLTASKIETLREKGAIS